MMAQQIQDVLTVAPTNLNTFLMFFFLADYDKCRLSAQGHEQTHTHRQSSPKTSTRQNDIVKTKATRCHSVRLFGWVPPTGGFLSAINH